MTFKEIKLLNNLTPHGKEMLISHRRRELNTLKQRRKKGLCCAILCHGPGHQSSTFCEKRGKHNIHSCTYGNYEEYMAWRKMKAFTGYFDEPRASPKD